MNETDKKILIDSINAAKNTRTYIHADQPACVIAQIAFRLGVSIEDMVNWGNQLWFQLGQYPTPGAQPVWDFEKRIGHDLTPLQDMWDRKLGSDFDDNSTRSRMINLVNTW